MSPGVSDERVDVGRWNRVRQCTIIFGDQGNGRQIAKLETGIFVGGEVDRLEMCTQKERVAVGGPGDHVTRGDNAARSRLILDKDTLAERLAKLVGDESGRNIGRPTNPETDHQPDRPIRVAAAATDGRRQNHNQAQDQQAETAHIGPPASQSHFRFGKATTISLSGKLQIHKRGTWRYSLHALRIACAHRQNAQGDEHVRPR